MSVCNTKNKQNFLKSNSNEEDYVTVINGYSESEAIVEGSDYIAVIDCKSKYVKNTDNGDLQAVDNKYLKAVSRDNVNMQEFVSLQAFNNASDTIMYQNTNNRSANQPSELLSEATLPASGWDKICVNNSDSSTNAIATVKNGSSRTLHLKDDEYLAVIGVNSCFENENIVKRSEHSDAFNSDSNYFQAIAVDCNYTLTVDREINSFVVATNNRVNIQDIDNYSTNQEVGDDSQNQETSADNDSEYQELADDSEYQELENDSKCQEADNDSEYQEADNDSEYQEVGNDSEYQEFGNDSTYQEAGNDGEYQEFGNDREYQYQEVGDDSESSY